MSKFEISNQKQKQFPNSPAIKQNISPCYTMHTNTISSMCSKSLQIEGINVQRQLLIELRISFNCYDTREISMYQISDKIAHEII